MINLENWIKVYCEGLKDCLATISKKSEVSYGEISSEIVKKICGPVVQINVGTKKILHVGLTASPETNQFLSELKSEEQLDEILAETDSSDAIGEILNMAAGYFARNVFKSEEEPAVLSTPVFIFGQLELPTLQDFIIQEVQISEHTVSLFIGFVMVK